MSIKTSRARFPQRQHSYIESSFGWDPKEKKEELFHKDARYIIAHIVAQDDSPPVLTAYGSFRFDMEEMMSGDEEPVLYCYELQVSTNARRAGLGSALMSDIEALARAWSLNKVMLTCFCANTSALAFYRRIGCVISLSAFFWKPTMLYRFVPDAISPSQEPSPDESAGPEDEEPPADYEIMSKVVQSNA